MLDKYYDLRYNSNYNYNIWLICKSIEKQKYLEVFEILNNVQFLLNKSLFFNSINLNQHKKSEVVGPTN